MGRGTHYISYNSSRSSSSIGSIKYGEGHSLYKVIVVVVVVVVVVNMGRGTHYIRSPNGNNRHIDYLTYLLCPI